MLRPYRLPFAATASLLLTSVVPIGAAEAPDFAKEIGPIFQARCIECHGPDQNGGLRLDDGRAAFLPTDSGVPAIVAGKPEASTLLTRLSTDEADLRMPPEGDPLPAAEVEAIRRWIAAGAEWPRDAATEQRHWAYVAPERPSLPAVNATTWPKTAIDHFVLARLEAEGLAPSEEADRALLLRRLRLTLTGLPPTPAEVEAFLADGRPDAYERVVDRLLDDPAFGEHWARLWLDLARYADSNGFQADQLRENWAYRDWVIDAFASDKPFDQFAVEQLAGDLLPNATLEQKIATGFHRLTTCNVEAGVHPEENRVNQIFDRVNTTGTVFLGTTLECAQCHNHKYDPFTQLEYYQLFAYFNNTPLEVENVGGVTFDFYGPKMELPLPPDEARQRESLLARQAALQRRIEAWEPGPAFVSWQQEMRSALASPPQWHVLTPIAVETTGGEETTVREDGSVLLTGPVPDVTTYHVSFDNDLPTITALRLEALTDPKLPGNGPGRGDPQRTNFVLHEFATRLGGADAKPLPFAGATADFSQDRWDVSGAIDGNRKTGWAIAPRFGKPHWAIFELATPLESAAGRTQRVTVTLDQHYGSGRVIGCFRISALTGDPAVLDLPDPVRKLLAKDECSPEETKQLEEHYASSDPAYQKLQRQRRQIDKQLAALEPATTLVMVERDEPRATHLMKRGNYLAPGPRVEPGTPATLHVPADALPPNRLGFARWLVADENPLLGRVIVNRWWYEVFGRGLVETPEDFGTRADPPTHPELLDWLAVEFRESGWSTKAMVRQMVTSATFRQTSSVTSELADRDPGNRWYARGPRFRMPAEAIRDQALAAAGLLSTDRHGPPVMPYQPEGIWRAVGRNAPKWQAATDGDRFRRGLYTVWRRAAPYPSFVNFDAPDRAACTVTRPRTNTPLQALTLLNDYAYAEAAIGLAQRSRSAQPGGTDADQARHAFRLLLAREPNRTEVDELLRIEQAARDWFSAEPQRVDERLSVAVGIPLPTDAAARLDLATWSIVASVLLNLDETVNIP